MGQEAVWGGVTLAASSYSTFNGGTLSQLKVAWTSFLILFVVKAFAIQGAGTTAIDNSDPISSKIVFVAGQGWSCTGTLISPNLVVTAAHCIQQPEGSVLGQQIVVHVGSITDKVNYSEDGRWMRVSDVRVHESYKPNVGSSTFDTCSQNDIALLKVDPTDLSATGLKINPIGLLRKTDELDKTNAIRLYGMAGDATLRSIIRPFSSPTANQLSTCLTIDWPLPARIERSQAFA